MSDVTDATLSSPTGARCAFCEHVNPPGAKYCNECAADLALVLCGQCAAVNRRGMSNCHKCGATLVEPRPQTEPPAPSVPATVPPPPRSRRLLGALLALAGAIALGAWYFGDQAKDLLAARMRSLADGPAPVVHQGESLTATTDARPPEPSPSPSVAEVAQPPAAPAAVALPEPEPAPPAEASCPAAIAALSLCERRKPDERK
jgi:hypothetical protein